MQRGGPAARYGRVLHAAPHIVARADSNGELGCSEEVQDAGRVGVGLELAAGGVVRGVPGVVLVNPALEIAEQVFCVQAAPVGVVGRRQLQGHHERVVHGPVDAAAIGDVDGHRRHSANAGDQEREDHLYYSVERCATPACGGWAECGESRRCCSCGRCRRLDETGCAACKCMRRWPARSLRATGYVYLG